MTFLLNVVQHNSYADSVALMRLSDKISGSPGIKEAAIMIGTPANKEILANANLLGGDGQSAGPGDIILAVRAVDQNTANRVIAGWESELNKKAEGLSATEIWRPKTIRGAFEQQSDASMAIISVPGPFAIAEARKALTRNLNVLIFSDNVAIDEERAIKEEAKSRDLIVMGPDCGTAIIQGKMLGFANSVPNGKIGIVGASGTGIQEVSCLLAHMGHGISHAIGVGGRDLTEQVGGISTLTAIDLLEKDPQTDHVIIISKPPSEKVCSKILSKIERSSKTFTVCFLGSPLLQLSSNARQATTLELAALLAANQEIKPINSVSKNTGAAKRILGLYAGGTLAAEAQIILIDHGFSVTSNAPVPGALPIGSGNLQHTIIDLGADEYTQGRPHPMIEPSVRSAPFLKACDDPTVGAILCDIVIGNGAHANPAGLLISLLSDLDHPPIFVSVTGTNQDPQGRDSQMKLLESAGCTVASSNAEAARMAISSILPA